MALLPERALSWWIRLHIGLHNKVSACILSDVWMPACIDVCLLEACASRAGQLARRGASRQNQRTDACSMSHALAAAPNRSMLKTTTPLPRQALMPPNTLRNLILLAPLLTAVVACNPADLRQHAVLPEPPTCRDRAVRRAEYPRPDPGHAWPVAGCRDRHRPTDSPGRRAGVLQD